MSIAAGDRQPWALPRRSFVMPAAASELAIKDGGSTAAASELAINCGGSTAPGLLVPGWVSPRAIACPWRCRGVDISSNAGGIRGACRDIDRGSQSRRVDRTCGVGISARAGAAACRRSWPLHVLVSNAEGAALIIFCPD